MNPGVAVEAIRVLAEIVSAAQLRALDQDGKRNSKRSAGACGLHERRDCFVVVEGARIVAVLNGLATHF